MAALLDQVNDRLAKALASLESEVGDFLKQKERILNGPRVPAQQALLNENASIKDRAAALMTEAQAVKSALDAFDPLDFSKYTKVPGLVQAAGTVAPKVLEMREAMRGHRSRVDAYLNAPASGPNAASAQGSLLSSLASASPAKKAGLVVLVLVAGAVIKKGRKK